MPASRRSACRSIARYRRRALAVFAIGCLVAAAGAVYMPRAFHSEAKWLVAGQPIAGAATAPPEVSSLIEIVRSRPVLDRVASELGPDCILRGGPPQPEPVGVTSPGPEVLTPKPKIPTQEHLAAVARLERLLVAFSPSDSQIVTIGCVAPTPAAAQEIVRAIGEAASRDFEQLVPPPAAPIAVQESALSLPPQPSESKSQAELAVLQQRQVQLQSELSAIEAQLQANDAQSKSAEVKIASLIALLAAPPATTTKSESVTMPPEATDLRQQLAALMSHEQELAAKMNDNHPQLVAVRQQIADLQASVGELPSAQLPQARSPSQPSAPADTLAAERAQAEALAIQKRSLFAARKQLDRQLADVTAQVDAYSKADGQVAVDVPVEPVLDPPVISPLVPSPPITRLTLIQPASYNANELPPGRAGVFAVSVLLAALSSLFTAILAAARNPIICTPRQLQRIWNVPLTGTIPPDLRVMTAAG